ncbi:4-hydroxy-tetrahydrodipicolinate synthase [Actinoplanes octamycinicus]|uniref:4-hydroxy-tetrahydrodipicolinate synthase n=1 Tax=Actinoplanes octamycinicus TaxID=135948 RepID=A0A7W7H2R2_9ACTN|nr:dihydrodipicolinate synthase family protein [Actinoplanes octamycinicus]MBB4742612.1 4-hydroxy-tetrahydrodipicolinate synthase [Actinoplanes octamycinicus]GIE60950.1 4-hydroxy-tetrahydrodipicolinate synthase [Actinoplanes octamycinicus]
MELTGVFVPMITPFDASGAVALPALRRLAHEVLDAGATGLVALGTTGEPAALTDGEREQVLDVLSRVCATHGAPLLGPPDERCAAAVSLVPPFVRPGPDGVVAHFTALAATSPVPLVVYHVPPRTGQSLDAATLRRIGALDRVIGIKYATGALDADLVALLADPPPGFAVLSGDDVFLSPLLALGAAGGILASAHVATGRFVALTRAWRCGDLDAAGKLGHHLAPLSAALFAEPNPTVIKAVLHAHGRIPTPAVRLPLLAATASATQAALRLAG